MASPVDVLMDTLPMTVGLTSMNVQIQTSVIMERARCVYSRIISQKTAFIFPCSFRIPMDRTLVSVMLATLDSIVRRRLMSVNQTPVQMAELAT